LRKLDGVRRLFASFSECYPRRCDRMVRPRIRAARYEWHASSRREETTK